MSKEKETQIIKTGRGGKYNFPSTVPPEDENDVRQALASVKQWYDIGKTKPADIKEWKERTDYFFSECINNGQRPTWEKYCLCMGYTRKTMWDIMTGTQYKGQEVADIIKTAKEYCAAYDAEMVTQGKLNPVPYIFRAKNYYGMKDNQDITITPNTNIVDVSAEDIATKYQELED